MTTEYNITNGNESIWVLVGDGNEEKILDITGFYRREWQYRRLTDFMHNLRYLELCKGSGRREWKVVPIFDNDRVWPMPTIKIERVELTSKERAGYEQYYADVKAEKERVA